MVQITLNSKLDNRRSPSILGLKFGGHDLHFKFYEFFGADLSFEKKKGF